MTKIRFHLLSVLCLSCVLTWFHGVVLASEYMHQVQENNATGLDLSNLVGKSQGGLLQEEGLPERAKGNGVLSLHDQRVRLSNPVLPNSEIQKALGRVLRFHIWIKAEDIDAGGNLWFGAPTVTFSLFDDNGNKITQVSSLFKTRGTYPWHCYYVDVPMPRQIMLTNQSAAANSEQAQLEALAEIIDFQENGDESKPGFYVTFSCYGSGTAWFGGMSYEELTTAQAANRDKWLDSATNTSAPNPEYDELPVILYYGLPADKPWKFLSGNNAFRSILTIQGLKEYLEASRNDWFHLQKGVAMLPYLYVTASKLQLCPEGKQFEDGWLDALEEELLGWQDPETGFWTVNGVPNLLVTEAIASNCFSPMSQERADQCAVPTPWHSVADGVTLPHADKIIETLLSHRIMGTSGWNEYMLQPAELGGTKRDTMVSLGATTAAVKLLILAASTLPAEDARRKSALDEAKRAYLYATKTFLKGNKPGLWRESTAATDISTTGAFLLDLLDVVPLLESHRANPDLPKPTIEVAEDSESDEKIQIRWKNPQRELVSVRIYGTRANVDAQTLTEKNICCIIEQANAEDPLMTAKRIVEAANTEWGITPAAVDCHYLAAKVALLPSKVLVVRTDSKKPFFQIEPPSVVRNTVVDEDSSADTSIVYYAVGVNAYGETTGFIPLNGEATAEDDD
ncbi:MAG: hypothetical protein IKS83_01985 [Victivallales bacterium]|nr:hypothetical protein [Victivallales bacterium]